METLFTPPSSQSACGPLDAPCLRSETEHRGHGGVEAKEGHWRQGGICISHRAAAVPRFQGSGCLSAPRRAGGATRRCRSSTRRSCGRWWGRCCKRSPGTAPPRTPSWTCPTSATTCRHALGPTLQSEALDCFRSWRRVARRTCRAGTCPASSITCWLALAPILHFSEVPLMCSFMTASHHDCRVRFYYLARGSPWARGREDGAFRCLARPVLAPVVRPSARVSLVSWEPCLVQFPTTIL